MNRHLLAAKTALRYLFAPKSHSAINVISIVSVCGIAVATMAMICVMSVYNGFQDFLGSRVESMLPDVEVRSAKGKVIADADSLCDVLGSMKEVEVATPIVEENMMIYSDHRMVPVKVLGVDAGPYAKVTSIASVVAPGGSYTIGVAGDAEDVSSGDVAAEDDVATGSDESDAVASMEFDEAQLFADAEDLYSGDDEMTDADQEIPPQNVLLTSDVVNQLWNSYSASESKMISNMPMTLMLPRRTAAISTVNLENAFLVADIKIAGILPADKANFKGNMAIVSLPMARDMLEYTSEAASVYLKAAPGTDVSRLADAVRERVGEGYKVIDRDSQLSLHFNMMRIEKWITFLLLAFILVIASFNIISTLSMLIVEKRRSIALMRNLGASKSLIGEVFCWESFFVCLTGTIVGLAVGLLLCELQIHYGIIGIPDATDSLIIDSYPVAVRLSDIGWLMVPSALIALVTALISSRFARRNCEI